MSFKHDGNFVHTLDTFSEKNWEIPADKSQISGWSEEFKDSDARKSLLSAGCSRIKQFLGEDSSFYLSGHVSPKLKKNSLIAKISSHRPYGSKLTPKGKTRYLNKRFDSIEPRKSFNNSLQISAHPIFKLKVEKKKQQSTVIEKKYAKLANCYDKNFFIVQKSPPIVSGYSVTFYQR